MYSDDDLNLAVKSGVFTEYSVGQFRQLIADSRHTDSVDEENVRLISGFNDIFVVVACCLVLFSSLHLLKAVSVPLSYTVFVALAWGLAEFFVRRRKMALPAIVLLLSFVGGIFSLAVSLLTPEAASTYVVAAGATAVAALAHWRRFQVPITVAAGVAAIIALVFALLVQVWPSAIQWLSPLLLISGLLTFGYAMHWDLADKTRVTRSSDVAFWLHLLAAPLIVHPVFSGLGILQGESEVLSFVVIIGLYLLMMLVSIAVDRRIFMLSSLSYVLYAVSMLIKNHGSISSSFALTSVIMGGTLLLLSVWWHPLRTLVVAHMPTAVRRYVP